ncbi:MAG: homocysteine S-methyltransferase family protein [Eubacteriales bacterium]|nr:homocysteine S-methyltransferase family protein [Eubacteriales bacterium]MDD3880905.1 homocysteine S-methyltransferase family protein [Eubacteriales bacterium]MDD4511728.1 homocysteine S-methyltransferase family protein [Eubacteriales bacterium]
MPEILILDGGLGTMLQKRGNTSRPELACFECPELLTEIHREYIEAGASVICASTFSANALKLEGTGKSVREAVTAAVKCAKRAAEGTKTRIALDVAPLGKLMEPAGEMTFDKAYSLFAEMITAGRDAGADIIYLETQTDLLEIKAAVLAAKELTSLPVWASMTFEKSGRTFTGCSPEAMALTLSGLHADALGVNCSMGPAELLDIFRRIRAYTDLPMIIKPNAGLPDPTTGEYSIGAKDFAQELEKYLPYGVFAMGGCCGTTPEYTRELKRRFSGVISEKPAFIRKSALCSSSRVAVIDHVTVIGERINPTGKKLFKKALAEHDMDYIITQAAEQQEAGAEILDVNVGLPGIDEKAMMTDAVRAIQGASPLPLQIDSADKGAIEAALRIYAGKPIINSVTAEKARLDAILPLCYKYGAAVVGLTMDEKGIPLRAEERLEKAEIIAKAADEYGIPREDLFIDCLTLTASAQQKEVMETLRAVRMVKEKLGVKTVLGVSNISFGLPNRELVNKTFLTMAMTSGLDLPIMNPNNAEMISAVRAYHLLSGYDENCEDYINRYQGAEVKPTPHGEKRSLFDSVLKGLAKESAESCRRELETREPLSIVQETLIPALDKVGELFERGRLFLPQLLRAAEAAQSAFECIRLFYQSCGRADEKGKGPVIIATVQGDIHDIGKNIVKVVMNNYGYEIIDLGKDVPPEEVLKAAKETGAKLIGLSALMTTTLPAMEKTIALLRGEGITAKIMVGGAVLTKEYAEKIGADYYAKDAKASADIAKEVIG